jgi:hypothetical protein
VVHELSGRLGIQGVKNGVVVGYRFGHGHYVVRNAGSSESSVCVLRPLGGNGRLVNVPKRDLLIADPESFQVQKHFADKNASAEGIHRYQNTPATMRTYTVAEGQAKMVPEWDR